MRPASAGSQRKFVIMGAAAVLATALLYLSLPHAAPEGFAIAGGAVDQLPTPKRRVMEGLDTLWERPPGDQKPKGLLFFAHGCSHQGTDFWPPETPGCPDCLGLPEEMAIRQRVLARGYVFVAITSIDRQSKCWDTTMNVKSSEDGARVPGILAAVQKEEGLQGLPLYAAGASSGGAFALMLPHLMKLQGVCAQIASLKEKMFTKGDVAYPPTLFVHMPRDERIGGLVAAGLAALKARGLPAAEIRVQPRAVTADWLSQQSPLISSSMAAAVVKALADGGLLDEQGLLREDPRATDWRALVAAHVGGLSLKADASQLSELLNVAYARHEIVSEFTDVMLSWLEAGGSKSVEELQAQASAGVGYTSIKGH